MRAQISLRCFLIGALSLGTALAWGLRLYVQFEHDRSFARALIAWEQRDIGLLGHYKYLVQAETTSAVPLRDARSKFQARVTTVYYGPAELVGRGFDFSAAGAGQGNSGVYILVWADGRLRLDDEREDSFLPISARTSETHEYERSRAFGETLRQLSRLDDQSRIDALKELVANSPPEVAAWAVQTLKRRLGLRIQGFLREVLTADLLPLRAQIAADAALAGLQDTEWFVSPQRLALMHHWITTDATKDDAAHLFWWLGALSERTDRSRLEGRDLVDIVKKALANRSLAQKDREKSIYLLHRALRRDPADAAAVAFLADFLRNGADKPLRIFAATHLGDPQLLKDESLRQQIEQLSNSIDDAEVADALRQALLKAQPVAPGN